MLDPNHKNELGKGIFDPEREAKLIAEGYTFARRVRAGTKREFLITAKTPIAQIAADIFNPLINNTIVFQNNEKK